MKAIRRYTAKGYQVLVIEYDEGAGIMYRVGSDFPGVPDGAWFKEYEKSNAIAHAQFLAGWIERQKVG